MIMMVMTSAFLIWQVPAMDFFERLAVQTDATTRLISVSGFVIWAVALLAWLMMGRIGTRGASPAVASALEDELVQSNRARSILWGYVAALVASAVMFGLSMFKPVTGGDAAHLILVVTIVVPVYAFIFLDRDRA